MNMILLGLLDPWTIGLIRCPETSVANYQSASHKYKTFNGTSENCGFVLHSILGHAGGGNRCGGYALLRLATTHWLTRLWSTQP
jgi:hypothetical protein